MADILFKPICSNCGKLLDETVDCVEWDDLIVKDEFLEKYSSKKIGFYMINPYCCPWCGAKFDRVKMHTKLPYDPSDFD